MIRYPWTEARTESRLSLNTDIAPTIAELAGVSMPYRPDGFSLVPRLTNSATDWRSSVLLEYQESGQTPSMFWAVRTDSWKYSELATGKRELHDLAADPFELTNVAVEPAYAEIQALLAAELERLKSEGGPPPPANRPPVAGDDFFATMQDTTKSSPATGGRFLRHHAGHDAQRGRARRVGKRQRRGREPVEREQDLRSLPRNRDPGREQIVHLYARRGLQRHGQLQLPGKRRHRAEQHGDSHDHHQRKRRRFEPDPRPKRRRDRQAGLPHLRLQRREPDRAQELEQRPQLPQVHGHRSPALPAPRSSASS